MKILFFVIFIGIPTVFFTQNRFFETADSIKKNRVITTSSLVGGIYVGSFVALNQIWYADYEKTKLHSFNDSKNWLQMDKVGHFYSAYHFSELVAKSYRWSGVRRKNAALIGAGVGWGYQFSIELLDGYSSGWGFSWTDITSNTIGSLLYLSQELIFSKQVLKVKFSYLPSDYAKYRPNILGSNFSEKLLKDYNAQTYWLSFSPFQFKKDSKLKWLALALGYSVDSKIIGDAEYYLSPDGKREFFSKREWILSFDIDVKELPIKKQWLKSLLSPFNSIKIPFPAVIWRGNNCYGSWVY